jgi:hypothetical protein
MECSTNQTDPDEIIEWGQIEAGIKVDLEKSARECKAISRRREVRSAGDLLRMVLAYSLKDWSLETVSIWALVQGIGVFSKVAVRQRIRHCLKWMGVLLAEKLRQHCSCLSQQAEGVVRLMDATIISPPGVKGTGWRVHLNLDLEQMCVSGVEVTDAHGAETLARMPPQPGEIRIADRGYAFASSILSMLRQAYVLVRVNWQNPLLLLPNGQRFDPIPWIQNLTGPAECQVFLSTPDERYELRFLACPLPAQSTQKARRKARCEASRKNYLIKPNTLIAAGYLLLLTNLPPERWPIQRVFWLYRMRWQVELYFKRLKSILTLDHLHAKNPDMVQTYLLAKLLSALLLEDLCHQVQIRFPDWFLDLERPISIWRLTSLFWNSFCNLVYGHFSLPHIMACLPALRRHLADPPRSRPQQLAWAQAFLQHLAFPSSFLP